MSTLFSILLPTYKRSFLKECKQSFLKELELKESGFGIILSEIGVAYDILDEIDENTERFMQYLEFRDCDHNWLKTHLLQSHLQLF